MTLWNCFGLTLLAQVTAIIVVAAVPMLLARRRAAVRHNVGAIALLLALVSPLFILLLPRAGWLAYSEQPSPSNITDETEAIERLPAVRDDAPADRQSQPSPSVPDKPAIPASSEIAAGRQAFNSPPLALPHSSGWYSRWLELGEWLWIAGIVLLAAKFLIARQRLRSLANSLRPARSISAKAIEEVQRSLGLSTLPPIAVSDLAPMPLVLGCRRPVVVLPQAFLANEPLSRVRDVLIHECAHVLRRDPLLSAAQRISGVIFWLHPGIHWLNRELGKAREEVCDNFVLKCGNAAEYAQTLLDLAERWSGPQVALSSLGLFSRRWTLEQRISEILNPNRERAIRGSRRIVFTMTIALGAVIALIGGVGAWAESPNNAPTPRAPSLTDEVPSTAAQAAPGEIKSDSEKAVARPHMITIRGNCQDQTSKPIGQARVRVYRLRSLTDAPQAVAEVKSDDDGRFAMPAIEVVAKESQEPDRLFLVATADGHESVAKGIAQTVAENDVSLVMSNKTSVLSGVVTDADDKPVKGVVVFLSPCGQFPISGFKSAITDERGHYAITDIATWKPEDSRRSDPKTGRGFMVTSCAFCLLHPDYATTTGMYSAIPQEVNVKLHPPAIIEGAVIDDVTGQPIADASVCAQGVVHSEWHQVKTDDRGHYRLVVNKEHFNIWAEADDRIAIAIKALAAESGKSVTNADVHMVRGGFVFGTVIDAKTNRPLINTGDGKLRVAHYGPARPKTGAAVTATPVNADGTYRLRVAPGENYVYLMSGNGGSAVVNVQDGQEIQQDLRTGVHARESKDPDLILRQKLIAQDQREAVQRGNGAAKDAVTPAKRTRPDTPAGRLLNKLEDQNSSEEERFTDEWCRTLKETVDLGPAAVPDLINELDATNNDMMLRCVCFMLRAIGDKRATSALIRAIPKTLVPPGSEYGLLVQDADLERFAQQHDLSQRHDKHEFNFGMSVRELFGTLHSLTGQKFDEEELFGVFLQGTARQQQMKQQLFYRTAMRWTDWWEHHADQFNLEPAYIAVNLPKMSTQVVNTSGLGAHYKTTGGASGWVLESVLDPKAQRAFYDLDTGRTASLPEKWKGQDIASHLGEITAWAAREGFDLMGTEYQSPDGQRYYALQAIGLRAWELGKSRWKLKSDDITVQALQEEGIPVDGLLLHFDKQADVTDPKAVAPFLYITREGTPGLLFVGVEVKDDSLKPGGVAEGDGELRPIAFKKGRRFGFSAFEEVK